jgi:hypothetical protein
MIFPYKQLGDGYARPIIPIDIRFGGEVMTFEVLIDSGADLNVLPADVGAALGIPIEEGKKVSVGGIGGSGIPLFIHPVSITVGGWSYHVEMGFMPDMPSASHGVVGQSGFFDLFKVIFDFGNERIELHPYHVPGVE